MSDNVATGSGSSSGNSSAIANTTQSGSGQSGGQTGSKPLADVKELGGQLLGAAQNGANSLYEEQRDRAADEISALGETLKKSAQSLDGALGQAIAPYAETAAQQVGGFADTMRDRSLNQVASDIEGFARQWPMAFIAAAIGVGFVAGRFLLSSGASISDVVTGQTTTDGKPAQRTGANRADERTTAGVNRTTGSSQERAGYGAGSGAGSH